MTIKLSEVRCPHCGESFWQMHALDSLSRTWRFRCFNDHVWEVGPDDWVYDAMENHAVIRAPDQAQRQPM